MGDVGFVGAARSSGAWGVETATRTQCALMCSRVAVERNLGSASSVLVMCWNARDLQIKRDHDHTLQCCNECSNAPMLQPLVYDRIDDH